MEKREIVLTEPQFELVAAEEPYPAIVAGFGAGKTNALITRALYYKSLYPDLDIAYYLPTYDLVRTIAFPRFTEVLENVGARYRLVKNPENTIYIENGGSIIFRSMDNPERIVGYEVADSFLDELDTLKTDAARDVWQKALSRNRQKKPDGKPNTMAVGTTPEGFAFVFERWKKNPAPGYRLIKASTYSNEHNLPAGYIQSLKDSYPANLLKAYLEGEFVNLTSGSVYPGFDRQKLRTFDKIQKGEPLHCGLDFNVGKMSCVVFVIRQGMPIAVDELTEVFDTPAMIRLIQNRYDGHRIFVYPDASGNARKSNNASQSDIALLKQARFQVCVNPTNPAVKDRVLSVNKLIETGALRVNTDACPELTDAFEKQAYDKHGEPDKTSGFDHVLDAAGYMLAYRFPIQHRKARNKELRL